MAWSTSPLARWRRKTQFRKVRLNLDKDDTQCNVPSEALVQGRGFGVDGVDDDHPDGDLHARVDDPADDVGQEVAQ